MIFSLDVRRARKGDCLLLHFGTTAKPGLVMIDGGPSGVYQPHLKPRLLAIKKARDLAEETPLPVDLLMVSHVDDDHIQGVLDLTKELREGGQPGLVRVKRFWHNSFDDLIANDAEELTASITAQFGAAALTAGLDPDATVESDEAPEVVNSSLQVLASIEQGHRLRGDVKALQIPLNPEFDGKLIVAGAEEVAVPGGLRFVVAGPMLPELKALQKKHAAWLQEQAAKPKSSGEALAAYVDPSVPNLSSIVVLAMAGEKKILLTGDARGDKILRGLEDAGLLVAGGEMKVDVLKVPHHGSSNNLEKGFFERILADHYVFSGNGEHGNPERESMEMLFGARGSAGFQIHLTYPVADIDVEREKDWEKEQKKEIAKKEKGGKKDPRANWSASEQSLTAYFEKQKLAPGQEVHIVDSVQPHVIDLLEKLGY